MMLSSSLTKENIHSFDQAQRNAIRMVQACVDQLHLGQSEEDVIQFFLQRSAEYGFLGFLRRPVVHFNYKYQWRLGPSHNRKLIAGSVVQIHIQPYTNEAFGNAGCSFCFQSPDLPIITVARDICVATSTFANAAKKAGELFVFAQSWATNHLCTLNKESVGHFCFANDGSGNFLWPHNMHLFTQLRRYQLQWYNPRPLDGIYAIHPDIKQHGRRVGFAELIYIDAQERRVLGRDSMDALCQYTYPR